MLVNSFTAFQDILVEVVQAEGGSMGYSKHQAVDRRGNKPPAAIMSKPLCLKKTGSGSFAKCVKEYGGCGGRCGKRR